MRHAGWVRFGRRERSVVALLGAVTGAAARGETIRTILELAARGLLEVGSADRAAIWLASSQQPEIYLGTVVEAGSGLVPEEWKRLDVSVPYFHARLESEEPILEDLDKKDGLPTVGPLAGMSSAAWVALRARQRSLGLVLVASARPRRLIDVGLLRTLADGLAITLAERQDRELAALRQAELASREQLLRALLRGAPKDEILAQIAREAARHTHAEFIALGQTGGGPLCLEALEGPREWASLILEEPIAEVWRTALAEGRVVSVGLGGLKGSSSQTEPSPLDRLLRVVALPLEARGERQGVLLAGLPTAKEQRAELERLDSYATLTATALWQEHTRRFTQEAEHAYQALLESSAGRVLVLEREGIIGEATRAAMKQMGLEAARLGQVRLEELFLPEERAAIAAWRASSAREPLGTETPPVQGTLLNGLTVRMSMCRSRPEAQLPAGRWHVRVEDLTALQAAEEKSRAVEAELRSLLDAVESGVVLLDATGRIRLVNDRFAQLMGLDARRLMELATFDALVEAVAGQFREPKAFAERWREVRQRGDEASWDELELMRPTRKVVERFTRPVLDAEGRRTGWLEVYRDITSQRLIQSKLLQTEKMAALGQLVSGIAHELNNPLTSIMGYAQLLLSRRPGPERRNDARMIYQEAERAGRIVKNLLLFARETKPERRAVDLNEIVERTLALRSYELKVENIVVDFQLEPDLPPTLADATQLQQVVLNLVVNAEQAIQQGRGHGHIRIRTQRLSPRRLALEVADDGPGIPPQIASRIFDPFFTTKPVGVGTGLGLSIVYGIVQAHGGEISVESPPGGGTTFLVELPIVDPSSAETAPGEVAAARAPLALGGTGGLGPGGAPRSERVLVVEDEPAVAQLIADVVGEEGHRVDVVLDSREALDRIVRQAYDLVICDLKMPYLDGRALYRALVRVGSPLQHRMVLVTGDTLASHTLEFLESTGLPYLAKPFLVEELKLAVRRAFGGGSTEAPVADAGSKPEWFQDAARKR